MVYLLWAGSKLEAGHQLTEEEAAVMSEAREVAIALAGKLMRIKPHEFEYTPGQGFD
jgi:hypothetical protein